MTEYGYTLMCEQTGPKQLVADAQRAEDAGFDFAVISDHYFPWLDEQGHSPYAWSVLGAVAHATERMGLMTYVGQVPLCYDTDETAARQRAHEQFRWFAGGWPVNAELPGPTSFDAASQFATEDDLAEQIACGPDVDRHVESIKEFVDAGFTHVALVQVGGGQQDEFNQWAEAKLLPALRSL